MTRRAYDQFHASHVISTLSAQEANSLVADISYTLSTSGLRGHNLQLAYSVIPANRNGILGVRGYYRMPMLPYRPPAQTKADTTTEPTYQIRGGATASCLRSHSRRAALPPLRPLGRPHLVDA
jgi:hypothetical protein